MAQIWCCCGCGVGHSCSSYLTPSLGTSICLRVAKKKKRKRNPRPEMLNHLLGSHSWAKAEADLKPEFLTANLRLFKMFTQFSLKSLLGKMRQRCAVRTAGEGGRLAARHWRRVRLTCRWQVFVFTVKVGSWLGRSWPRRGGRGFWEHVGPPGLTRQVETVYSWKWGAGAATDSPGGRSLRSGSADLLLTESPGAGRSGSPVNIRRCPTQGQRCWCEV